MKPLTALKGLIIPFIFILMISFSFAFEEFPSLTYNSYFSDDYGYYWLLNDVNDNSLITDTLIDGQSTSSSAYQNAPVFDDVNNDGTMDLFIVDDDDLKVYNSNTLSVIDEYFLNYTNNIVSNIEIANMDNDSNKEIIIITKIGGINFLANILDFNGTAITKNTVVNVTGLFAGATADFKIKCDDTDKACAIAQFSTGTTHYFGGFDSSGLYSSTYSVTGVTYNKNQAGTWITGDINKDGQLDYLFLITGSNTNTGFYGYITGGDFIKVDDDKTLVKTNCVGYFVTAQPILADIYSDGKLEIIYADCDTSGNFKMHVYDYQFNLIDSSASEDGKYLTNPFFFNLNNDNNLYPCVMGFDVPNQTSTLLCMERTGLLYDGEEFTFNAPYTVDTTKYGGGQDRVNSLPAYTVTVGSSNNRNVITPLGIFGLTGTSVISINELGDYNNINYIPISDDNIPYFDLLGISEDTLYYFEDGISNYDCNEQSNNCISYLDICPKIYALEGKTNTTLRFVFNFSDIDGDNVNYTFFIYYGEDNEQSFSGTQTFAQRQTRFDLKINESTSSSIMRLELYDVENPSSVYTESWSMFVSDDGQEYNTGLCAPLYDNTIQIGGGETEGEAEAEDNAVEDIVNVLEEETGLSGTLIWLIVMALAPLLLIYIIASSGHSSDLKSGLMFLGVVEVFLLILGFSLGLVSSALIWLLVILAVGGLTFFIWRLTTGGG